MEPNTSKNQLKVSDPNNTTVLILAVKSSSQPTKQCTCQTCGNNTVKQQRQTFEQQTFGMVTPNFSISDGVVTQAVKRKVRKDEYEGQ